jgi:hypothetical protein
MQNNTAPKYKTAARAVLQKRIGELESKNLALQEELEKVRAQQMDALDAFLNKPRDLRVLINVAVSQECSHRHPADELKAKRIISKVQKDLGKDL